MKAVLHYSNTNIDRADHLRRDDDAINALWNKPGSILVPVHKSKNLIDGKTTTAILKTQQETCAAGVLHESGTFLGLEQGNACFAVHCDDQQAASWIQIAAGAEFSDLRVIGPMLPRTEASLLAYAKGVLFWQQQNPICSLCGAANQLASAGHMMICASADCGKQTFPRTDPAVIMLVERTGDDGKRYCLLGRSAQWPERVFSTLAGFVEVGETLESAVSREVFEEAGVETVNPRYMASQPWPFPQSIMLGFIATATTSKIVLDEAELAEARWFTDEEISSFGDWGDDTDNLKLPRKDSIARYLVDSWCTQQNLPS